MRAIPLPVRRRILQLYERSKSTREIAEFSGLCVAAVQAVSATDCQGFFFSDQYAT